MTDEASKKICPFMSGNTNTAGQPVFVRCRTVECMAWHANKSYEIYESTVGHWTKNGWDAKYIKERPGYMLVSKAGGCCGLIEGQASD